MLAILLCVRIRRQVTTLTSLVYQRSQLCRKQKQAYVRIAIEKSLRRQVVMGPTLSEKRGGLHFLLPWLTRCTYSSFYALRGRSDECTILHPQFTF